MLSTHPLINSLRALLLPWTCVVCGGAGAGSDLCRNCRLQLPSLHCCCARCAQPLRMATALCGRCLQKLPKFDSAFAPLRYRDALPALIQRFKLGGALPVGRVLSELLAEQLLARGPIVPQLLVPVPLHPARLRQRGFDQALEIARILARKLQRPIARDALLRVRDTPSQTGLKRRERRSNVYRAFAVGQLPPGIHSVALIDDVMTTGATVNACARVLKRAGVQQIEVWSLARAGR